MSELGNSNYNKLAQLPQQPYLIISKLIENNEDIWKLLKYPEADALDQSDLTLDEKRALIFNGENEEADCRVFTELYVDDSINERQSQLRVDVYEVRPDNYVYAQVNFGFLVISHNASKILNNYENRTVRLLHEVIKTLNGTEINGVGKLVFNRMRHESVLGKKIKINNEFSGYLIFMNVITA